MIEKVTSGICIGGILGGSYGMLRSFLSSPGYIEKLNPKPECFDIDPNVAKLFSDIARYRYVNEEAYVESIHNMDSLFCLEKQLQMGEVQPQITDPPSATQLAIRALTHLRDLRSQIKEEDMYKEMSEHIKSLEKITETHTHNIQLLCSKV